jgi:NAD(P)-dependent dehydrogenase (short-subunit alcohol dehydrogenase family)
VVKTILVAGAAGGIGESIVSAILQNADTQVFATSRSDERLETVRGRLNPALRSRLTPIVGDAGDFAGAAQIATQVAEFGGADAAVAILGRGWWTSGPLLELAPGDWKSVLDEMLTAHFAFARAVVPLLATRPGSLYLSIGGGAAFAPVRDAGLMSIAAAGQLMLTRVLAREIGANPPRVLELVINGPVNTRESQSFADPAWITADDVGRVVADLVLTGATKWPTVRTDGLAIVMEPSRR